MMNGRNNGKKLMAVRIVAHSFEIVCIILYIASNITRETSAELILVMRKNKL